jgi:hypothetical protein
MLAIIWFSVSGGSASIALITALSPGQSPPPVTTNTFVGIFLETYYLTFGFVPKIKIFHKMIVL